jgi:hypothetical protein
VNKSLNFLTNDERGILMADNSERRPRLLNLRFMTLVGITVAAAGSRLLPHPPNFTPLFAIALFGGTYFASRWAAFGVPLAAMFLSDLALGLIMYGKAVFPLMPYVYLSFVLTVLLGYWVRRRQGSAIAIGCAALASSVLFFVISNFGVWLRGTLYPPTLEGLAACYIAAIPFFKNTVAGNCVFSVALFGVFALAQHYVAAIRKPAPSPVRD